MAAISMIRILKRAAPGLRSRLDRGRVARYYRRPDFPARGNPPARCHAAGRDGKGKQLYRPIGPRTVNKTVPSLLRRIMRRAHKNWSATILTWPNWSQHFLSETNGDPRNQPRGGRSDRSGRIPRIPPASRVRRDHGASPAEVLLTWPQVNFERSTIAIVGKGSKPPFSPLTPPGLRTALEPQRPRPGFRLHFVAQRTRRCPKTKRDFIKGKRYPMTYYGIGTNRRRKWTKASVDARFHDTRHTTGMRTLRTTGN